MTRSRAPGSNDPPGQSIFTQGSADTLDVTGWHWTDSSVPDADEILHAYAIKFSNSRSVPLLRRRPLRRQRRQGHGLLVLQEPGPRGGERHVRRRRGQPGGAPGRRHPGARDVHAGRSDHDHPRLQVGRKRRVRRLPGRRQANFPDCLPGSAGNNGCNTVNSTTIKSPWAYQGKGSTAAANVIYGGGFMEGGIDLGALGLQGCFSSFMAETRSSPSLTAAQKDFTLGRFESCSSELTTTPADGSGTALTDSGERERLCRTSRSAPARPASTSPTTRPSTSAVSRAGAGRSSSTSAARSPPAPATREACSSTRSRSARARRSRSRRRRQT